ncbi:MAG: 2OG-Fe dioxygenase family protein [Vibrio sp.]
MAYPQFHLPNQSMQANTYSQQNIVHPQAKFQIYQLEKQNLVQIQPSFSELPVTPYADGQYRLRRYSRVYWYPDHLIESKQHDFMQNKTYNKFQGDVKRHFEGITHEVLTGACLKRLCDIFIRANQLGEGQEIEVHQMRIKTLGQQTPVAPEGIHQDGFDCIALIGIQRNNIFGGCVQVFEDKSQAAVYSQILADGAVVVLDDHHYWHYATPIVRQDAQRDGFMDVMVLTANR